MEFLTHVELSGWTWWKIGGPADHFCLPHTIEDVTSAAARARLEGWPITVLGGGTNVLVPDEGLRGLVICTRELRGIEAREENGRLVLTALAGSPKSDLLKQFLVRKLPPALFLCGLPGDVGGGVVMNAGVSEAIVPREFVELIDAVETVSLGAATYGERKIFAREELKWHYRSSRGWEPGLIVRVTLSWPLNDVDPELSRKVKDSTKQRLLKQPLELPSCGSTFKNPAGKSAGALIERAGLNGYRIGGAEVSLKHANFIVNRGGATAADVRQIIRHIQTEVARQFAVELECEVRFL